MTMCQKQLPPLFRRISSSRKGLKMTSAQLLAKNPRFEQLSELREQSHKAILNSIDIKESMLIPNGKESSAYNFIIE